MDASTQSPPRGGGLVTFAAVMILIVGLFNVIDGIVAIVNSDYYVDKLLFSDMDAWGWFFLVYGSIQFLVGLAIFWGSRVARFLGVIVAGLNAVAQLAFLGAYPAWSIIIMVVDGLVIYALTAHGDALSARAPREHRGVDGGPEAALAAQPRAGRFG